MKDNDNVWHNYASDVAVYISAGRVNLRYITKGNERRFQSSGQFTAHSYLTWTNAFTELLHVLGISWCLKYHITRPSVVIKPWSTRCDKTPSQPYNKQPTHTSWFRLLLALLLALLAGSLASLLFALCSRSVLLVWSRGLLRDSKRDGFYKRPIRMRYGSEERIIR